MRKSPKIGRKVEIRPKIDYSPKWWHAIFSVVFFHAFFVINVFIETIPRDILRFITFYYVEVFKNGPKVTPRP